MGFKHAYFIGRTIMINSKNDVQNSVRLLNRMMAKEGLLDQFRRTRFYEKPTHYRRRINYERMKAIYDEDMNRKIQFVLRKNRINPYLGYN